MARMYASMVARTFIMSTTPWMHFLADEEGDRMVVLAGQAIRGVALGVVVTALLQSALGGIGLAVAGSFSVSSKNR